MKFEVPFVWLPTVNSSSVSQREKTMESALALDRGPTMAVSRPTDESFLEVAGLQGWRPASQHIGWITVVSNDFHVLGGI